jgi:hypothetical protein
LSFFAVAKMSASKNQFSLVEMNRDPTKPMETNRDRRIGEVGVWTTIFNALADLQQENEDQVKGGGMAGGPPSRKGTKRPGENFETSNSKK